MRQRGSRRGRSRPNSRTNENIPMSHTEPSSPLEQSNVILKKCTNASENDNDLQDLPTSGTFVTERRTRSERYFCDHDRFFV